MKFKPMTLGKPKPGNFAFSGVSMSMMTVEAKTDIVLYGDDLMAHYNQQEAKQGFPQFPRPKSYSKKREQQVGATTMPKSCNADQA